MSPTTGARRHKHKPSVPSNVNSMDVNSLYNVSMASIPSMQPTPLAMPLHSGFDVPRRQPILPHHPGVSYPSQVVPGTTIFPDTRHRRSLSADEAYDYNYAPPPARRLTVTNGDVVPDSPPTATNPFSDANMLSVPTNASPSTPVTRLLTTTHARHSSSVDPFVTPFDDEHRVTIAHASHAGARKSVQTNPFAAVAM